MLPYILSYLLHSDVNMHRSCDAHDVHIDVLHGHNELWILVLRIYRKDY